ncbi:DUF3050 domain-containing protein [Microbulbifer sp. JSM ZJ756]|uniref:DUF3050 domain-containing protein n=1 Tax=Microbulbifer sp. JSM ZJ756 TaxID=3376191 RepID=UPI003795F227
MKNQLQSVTETLQHHELYRSITTLDQLRDFMSIHIFAVWDFMTLVKRLQNSLTCVTLPWKNPDNIFAARLINEIVFYEETDLNFDGQPASHLTMYLEAMEEIEADASCFLTFIAALERGEDLETALEEADTPDFVREFVRANIQLALTGGNEEVAANFLYGREDAIPEMFTRLLDQWGVDEHRIPRMTYYLKRHIDLDGDEHGPAAQKILENLIGGCDHARARAFRAAEQAIEGRIRLWDGILVQIQQAEPSARIAV